MLLYGDKSKAANGYP